MLVGYFFVLSLSLFSVVGRLLKITRNYFFRGTPSSPYEVEYSRTRWWAQKASLPIIFFFLAPSCYCTLPASILCQITENKENMRSKRSDLVTTSAIVLLLVACLLLQKVKAFGPSVCRSSSSYYYPQHSLHCGDGSARGVLVRRTDRPLGRGRTRLMALETAQSVLGAVDSFYQNEPYAAAFLTCSVKASAADFVAQRKSPLFDVSRNLAFLVYGGLYQGLFQQLLFCQIFPACFGTDHSLHSVALQVLTDMAMVGPFLCLPLAYATKSMFQNELSADSIGQGMRKYVSDVANKSLLLKYWSIWIPVQFLTFGVVPSHYRVAFIAMVSFFWMCILSTTSSGTSRDELPSPRTTQHA